MARTLCTRAPNTAPEKPGFAASGTGVSCHDATFSLPLRARRAHRSGEQTVLVPPLEKTLPGFHRKTHPRGEKIIDQRSRAFAIPAE